MEVHCRVHKSLSLAPILTQTNLTHPTQPYLSKIHFNIVTIYGVWLYTGFGLMIGFVGLFDTARDYSLQFTISHTLVSTVTFLLAVAR
jgi:hypothetical protein